MVTWIAVAGTKTGAMDATIAPTGITSATNDATARAFFVRMPPFLTSIVGKVRRHAIYLVTGTIYLLSSKSSVLKRMQFFSIARGLIL